jgi:hypothetical protein
MTGKQVVYSVRGVLMWHGTAEYVTLDGWVGIRQSNGRIDEAPIGNVEVI